MAEVFAPDRFRATMGNNLGLAFNNRFQVKFPNIGNMVTPNGGSIKDKTNGEDRSLMCTAAGMPGKQVNTVNRGYGIENQLAVTGHSMPEVSFTFYLPNTFVMREYFEKWMEACSSAIKDEAQYVGYYDEYSKNDIEVASYARAGLHSYTCKLINCFPTSINTIEFNNQAQTAAAEMTVSIAYRTYETKQHLSSIGGSLGF